MRKIYLGAILIIILYAIYVSIITITGYNNPVFIEGIKIPGYVKSDHQKFDLHSEENMKYMDNEMNTLQDFHVYALNNGIKYTMVAGSLLGCLAFSKPIPWDDDIDLIVRKSDWSKLVQLWDSGTDVQLSLRDKRWESRRVYMTGKPYLLLRNKKNNDWYKLTRNIDKKLPDVGGIDIGHAFVKNGRVYESMNKEKEAPGTDCEFDGELSWYVYGNIEIMSIRRDLGQSYLDTVYNPEWNSKEHPDYRKSVWKVLCSRLVSWKK